MHISQKSSIFARKIAFVMKRTLFLIALSAFFMACGGSKSSDEQSASQTETVTNEGSFESECRKVYQQVDVLQRKLADPQQYATQQGVEELQKLDQELTFHYNAAELDSAEYAKARQIDSLIAEAHKSIPYVIQQNVCNTPHALILKPEELLTETQSYPIYLERGDKLMLHIETEKPADIRIYNTNSHQLLKSYVGKKLVKDSISIQFSAVYLVEINPKGRQYANIDIAYKPNSVNRAFETKTVETREVEGQKGDFRVKAIPGIKMKNLFEEPRKFTLRGQLKAAFSGSYRAIVAVPVPQGANDILYSLRISTNEPDRASDGKFHDNMETSYKRIKMLGLPVYESHGGAGIISTLLGENQPKREEDAYINMYVFFNSAQAKKFQDGVDPAKLQYSIDYSTMGTQSCNGRIPSKGYKTIYLGFLNERMRYNNYVWLEAVSAVPNTEYLKTEYIVK